MKQIIATLSLLLLLTLTTLAQKNFQPGYVIQATGDTLHGFIDYRGDYLMGLSCRFRETPESQIIEFSPQQIKGYQISGSKYFITKESGNTQVFLEVLYSGVYDLYYRRDSLDHYYIYKSGSAMIELPYSERVIYKGDVAYQYKSMAHMAILKQYMEDKPEIWLKINSVAKLKKSWLIRLAGQYHSLVCPSGDCVSFIRNVPSVKLNIELSGGALFYANDRIDRGIKEMELDLNGRVPFQLGIITHLWLPNVNEKLYFRSGFVFINVPVQNKLRTIYAVPVQIEYIYPRGIIKPKIAGGLVLHFPFYHTWAVSAGLDLKLSRNIYLGLNWSPEFIGGSNKSDDVFFPRRLMLNGYYTGITFAF